MKHSSPLRVAFQMDPMESVEIDGDTTFALAEVAATRGMELFEYGPQHLGYNVLSKDLAIGSSLIISGTAIT